MQSRRDFLRLLGLGAGASIIGCGSSGGGDGNFAGFTNVPNAYQFTPLVNSGATLPRQRAIRAQAAEGGPPFIGSVVVNDRRHICFHANDDAGTTGVYEIDYDSSGSISDVQTVMKEGDVLPDGTVVDIVSPGDLNNSDDCIFVVEDPEGRRTLQYSKGGENFERFCTAYQDLSDEARLYGQFHSELSLADNGDIMFACGHRAEDGFVNADGLFYIPNETLSQTKLLLSNDKLLSGTASAIKTFGIFDSQAGGNYLVQGSAGNIENPSTDGVPMNYLVRGRVGEEPETLVATPGLGENSAIQGTVNMGPRMNGSSYGAIVQTDNNKTAFWLNGDKLLDADFESGGTLSPRGQKISSMFPPVFGSDGLIFIQVFTSAGTEVLVYDGQRFSTILASGDIIDGRTVGMIIFGAVPHCTNSFGDVVCVADFTDGTSSILLGRAI